MCEGNGQGCLSLLDKPSLCLEVGPGALLLLERPWEPEQSPFLCVSLKLKVATGCCVLAISSCKECRDCSWAHPCSSAGGTVRFLEGFSGRLFQQLEKLPFSEYIWQFPSELLKIMTFLD